MNYQQIPPPIALQPYIRYFGVLESDGNSAGQQTFKILADGCPGLIFQENTNCFTDQYNQQLPQLFVHGITTRHSGKSTTGRYRNIGVYFRPTALKAIFGLDAGELTDGYTALDNFCKPPVTQLLNAADALERIEILSSFLLQQLAMNQKKENPKGLYALNSIKQAATLAEIQASLQISERSLERIFKTDIGISPKLYHRINRFQSALDDIRKTPQALLTAIAYQHTYSDQSHFIRDFREFAGVTPKQFLLKANEQAVNFPEWKS